MIVNLPGEEWIEIEGYSGYSVSNKGRVKSTKLWYRNGRLLKPQPHKKSKRHQSKDEKPYYKVNLYDAAHKLHGEKVHRLVGKAFIPNPLNLPQINHKDTDKANNNADNLEWCDNSFNQKEAYKANIQEIRSGEINGRSYLKSNDVIEMRRLRNEQKIKLKDLAKMFNTSWQNVAAITSGRNWKHL